jgi:hypothetical protein
MEQAWDSAQHVGKMLLGSEPKIQNDFIAHVYTVLGYGLGLGFPPAASGEALPKESEAVDFFVKLATAQGTIDAFDWRAALRMAWALLKPILDQLLGG